MSMSDWAKNEVELACKRELNGRTLEEGEFDYGCACFKSALKAYNSLMEDDHSGMSFGFTRGILIRLMEHRPLTPIEGNDDEWGHDIYSGKEDFKSYQNKRLSCFWKKVAKDGTVSYSDNDRFYCIDDRNGVTYFSGLVADVINEMYPIELPYYPDTKPMEVHTQDCLADPKNGDFDTVAIFKILRRGETVEVNRFFKSDLDDADWVEITKEEWERRLQMEEDREQTVVIPKMSDKVEAMPDKVEEDVK